MNIQNVSIHIPFSTLHQILALFSFNFLKLELKFVGASKGGLLRSLMSHFAFTILHNRQRWLPYLNDATLPEIACRLTRHSTSCSCPLDTLPKDSECSGFAKSLERIDLHFCQYGQIRHRNFNFQKIFMAT